MKTTGYTTLGKVGILEKKGNTNYLLIQSTQLKGCQLPG